MKRNETARPLAGILIAVMTGVVGSDARAAETYRFQYENPVSICQTALPVFDGQIRKRPKALRNEGTSVAFVTCSWSMQADSSIDGPSYIVMGFSIDDGVPDSISCTAILGSDGESFSSYTRSTDLHSNGGQRWLTWVPTDFGAGLQKFPSPLVSVSCRLNPGVGINESIMLFHENIGA